MDSEKSPSSQDNLGISAGVVPSPCTLARRFKELWSMLGGWWDICPIRSLVFGRCLAVLEDI